MAQLDRLIAAPALSSVVRRVGGSQEDASVRQAVLVEELGELVGVPERALVVMTKAASRNATGYRLDMALKLASSRGAAAILLTDGRDAIPATASAIAQRTRLVVLVASCDVDLVETITAIEREITGDAGATLARVDEALWALRAAERQSASPSELLEAASACLEAEMRLGEPTEREIGAPIIVDDDMESEVCVDIANGSHHTAAAAIAHLAAAAIGRARSAARRAEDVPIRSRGQLLAEFLLAPPDRGDRLLDRMRAAGLTVDGWHATVRLEFENLDALTADDDLAWYRLTEQIGRIALEHARTSPGVWHLAQLGSALVLVRASRDDAGTRGGRELARVADAMIQAILARAPKAVVVCGVGSVHVGSNGLRASSAEARAALAAARAGRRVNTAVSYDEVGLQRTLIEWYASDSAREAVDSLLAPLDKQKPSKRDASIRTLQSYLDHHGSLIRAAEELHMHRNAVAYRIDRIFDALGVDRADPDTRLLLQLACRARSLS